MAGHQFANAAEESTLLADVAEGEVLGEQRSFELGRNGGMLEEGFHFAGEGESAAVPEVVEGLFAEAIAGAEEFAGVLIPDGEGEHAAEALDAIGAVLFVGVENGFGVGAVGVAVSGLFESGAQAGVIEDFAVEDDEFRLVLVGHGLVAAGEVDDGEAAEAEGGPRVAVIAEIVGAAMAGHGIGHPLDGSEGNPRGLRVTKPAIPHMFEAAGADRADPPNLPCRTPML